MTYSYNCYCIVGTDCFTAAVLNTIFTHLVILLQNIFLLSYVTHYYLPQAY